jgi:hypothetical protein
MMKEEAPAQAAPAEGQAPQEGGGDPAEAIQGIASTVNEGLMMLAQAFSQIKSAAPAAKKMEALAQAFQQTVSEAMGGGGAPQEGPPPAEGMESQEAGGNPNARPAY